MVSLLVRRNVHSAAPDTGPGALNATAWASAAALTALTLLTTGCTGQDGETSGAKPGPPASAAPHGYVEGAQEAAEPQPRLMLNDPGTGDTRVLDLVTGKVHRAPRSDGATALGTDGRFGYLHSADGLHALDSGAWTVDHGDHAHYYRAAIRDLGRLPGGAGARYVRGDAAVTAVTGADGRASVHRRTELEKLEKTGTGQRKNADTAARPLALTGVHRAAVVPYADHLLTLDDDGTGTPKVAVYDRAGKRAEAPDAPCADPRGDAVTRRGVVFGCADGALLIQRATKDGKGDKGGSGGGFTAVRIPYRTEVPTAERAVSFRHRPGSDTLTAPSGDRAVWALDVGARTWTRVRTGPVVAVNTAGEGSPLLVLQNDGALHGYDIATGARVSRTERLLTGAPDGGGTGPVVEVDRSRAYVNDPAGSRVHEIDYNDRLRLARTLDVGMKPVLMVETGR